MKALVDYDSDGHSERDYTTSEPPDEALEQPQMPEDVDAIIRQTRIEMEQARLKADQLICQFAEAYVETAGQFREGAIQRYRERLEGLPAEACAKVCETLAKDDIFCCNMEFGNGHLSYGGMSFTYKVESDAAFNALSHHAWKDLHQLFVEDESSLPLDDSLQQGRPSVAHLLHSEDEDGLGSHQGRSESPPEDSDSSSDEEGSLLSGDSTGAFQAGNRDRDRSNFSPSPGWATEEEVGISDTPKRPGPGRPSKHKVVSDARKKRRPGRPPNEPWSAEEDTLIRETMATQLQKRGNLGCSSKIIMKLLEVFPRRSTSAIKNKWMRMKDVWDELGGVEGEIRARNAKGNVRVEVSDLKKYDEEDSGPVMQYDDGDDDNFDDHEVKPGSHEMNSWIRNRWTAEQDRLLTKRMHSEMQSAGVAAMSVPSTVRKELARSFGRKEKSISRRWSHLSGRSKWGGAEKRQEEKRTMDSILAKAKPQVEVEEQSQASSSRLSQSITPVQSDAANAAEASGPRRKRQPTKEHRAPAWSPQEVEILTRLTKGLNRIAVIDFKEITARLPDPSTRTEKACKVFWARHVQTQQADKDQNSIDGNEAPEKGGPDSSRIFDLPKQPKKGKKRGPEPSSDFESSKVSKKTKSGSKSKLLHSETAGDSSHRSRRRPWTREEDDLLWRLAESGIPWRAVAEQIPHRTDGACQLRYSIYLVKMPEYQERLNGQPGRLIRRHAKSRRDPKSDRDSPQEEDTVISVARRAKHARESGDEGKKRSAARRKRHGGARAQSSVRRRDHDDRSEAENSDVYMYDFE